VSFVTSAYFASHVRCQTHLQGCECSPFGLLYSTGIYGEKRLGEVFPKRSFAFPFMVSPNLPQQMIPSCRSSKMLNVAYRLKTRVILRDHGQQRAPDAAYSSFSHQLPFIVTPGSPNQATLDFILRTKSINNNSSTSIDSKVNSNKQLVRASNESFQLRGSLSDFVASTQSPSAIEALVRLDQIHNSAKPVTKITGKLIQVKVVYRRINSLLCETVFWQ
jgi:hypothetical protein